MKVKLTVDLLRDNNSSVFGSVPGAIVRTASTHTEARALVQAEIDARVAAATATAQELADANAAFNS